jgi:Mg-chelatase subunit ChlI
VEIRGITETRERMAIMERHLAYEASPEAFREQWQPKENELSAMIENARGLLEAVVYTSRDLLSIASLTASLNVEGHRSDLVILKAARAQAAFEGRSYINGRDIALAAELALPHRLRKGPFQQSEMGMEELQERIEELQGKTTASQTSDKDSNTEETADSEKKT